ncbi:MAG: SCO family protein [Sphingobacteriales bacterium]|nr:MAG: SCO family protein [Sphingobacteriales bacterium]
MQVNKTGKNSKTIKFIIGIAVAAVVPLSFFFITRQFSDGKIKIPAYFRPEMDQQDHVITVKRVRKGETFLDTVYHKVKDITLTNQLGKRVSLNNDLRGKILVIDFIFTNCPTVCPRLSANMSEIQKAYIKKNPELVQFISISIDPARDSVPALRAYADRFNADHDRWCFLTGDSKAIFDYAKEELGVTLQPSEANDGSFDHSTKVVLLDTARNIRGRNDEYYNGMDRKDTKQIADDIYILSVEKRKDEK